MQGGRCVAASVKGAEIVAPKPCLKDTYINPAFAHMVTQ